MRSNKRTIPPRKGGHRRGLDAIEFDGGLVLADTDRHLMRAYNETAREVWLGLSDGREIEDIAAALSRKYGAPKDLVGRDIRNLTEHWRSAGFLPSSAEVVREEAPDATSTTWNGAPQPCWSAKWTCKVRDLTVQFAVEPAEIVPAVRTLFQHLECSARTADVRFEIRQTSPGEAALIEDGRERMRASDPGPFKESVHRAIVERLYPDVDWFMFAHGGALARNGTGYALPGEPGAGKTTLIAYLITRGYEYLADDFIPLAGPQGTILPWPLPLSVKSKSWDVLAPFHPSLSEVTAFPTKGDVARFLIPPTQSWQTPSVRLDKLVFPRFSARGESSARLLRPLQALEELLRAGLWLGEKLHTERLRMLLRWIGRAQSLVLTYHDLPSAAANLEAAVSGSEVTTASTARLRGSTRRVVDRGPGSS